MITGQVPTHLIGNDAFQECDTTGITRPCTKHNYLVKDVRAVARTIHEAFYVARSGRPGPVVVDLPKDIQFEPGPYEPPTDIEHKSYRPRRQPEAGPVAEAVALIANAKRPVFYTGGGIINSGPQASASLRELVRLTGAPCTSTLMGLGAYPASDRQFLGMLGMHGTYEANLAMYNCDVMVNLGARFDDRVTGKLSEFSPGSKKIHVDIDPSSINKNVAVDVAVVGDVGVVIDEMIAQLKQRGAKPGGKALSAWWQQIGKWRDRDCLKFTQDTGPKAAIKPQYALKRLAELTAERDDVYITTEVGQHQMWAAQYLPFEQPNRWMTSGGLGTMGYGLPAAIGVQIAHPEALVVDIAGEASILMNIQEMSTAAQYRLPVKVMVLNNFWMGMVRQWQELLHGERYSETYSEALPDFVKLAESFGWVGLRCTKMSEVDDAIREMITVDRPVFLDMQVEKAENCFPMIPGGHAHYDMLLGPEDQSESPASEDGMVLV